jgi:peptide/nickel transport system substrate-binding protein
MENDKSKQSPSELEKLRSPKHIKKRLRKLESASVKHAHRFIIRRWENVQEVRRHALSWLLLVAVLVGGIVLQTSATETSYRDRLPAEGGTYAEGILGQIDTLNPIFATTSAERSAANLMFSGLLKYDKAGHVIGDLAESWQRSKDGKRYTVKLKPNLRWHDGAPITSRDVTYTISSIKNADVGSPYYSGWRNVIVKSPDDQTITFNLPAAYAPFTQLMTIGIIPEHAFSGIAPTDIRNAPFDRDPVGSGPFRFSRLQLIDIDNGRVAVHMAANQNYHGGPVKLERFQLHAYDDREKLRNAFMSGEVNAAVDLSVGDIRQLDDSRPYEIIDTSVNNVALAIMKVSDGVTSDKNIRQALRLATDRQAIIDVLDGRVSLLETPIPPQLVVGIDKLKQPAFSTKKAEALFKKAGWKRGDDGKLAKGKQQLKITLATVRTGDYPRVLEEIAAQWSRLGITVETLLADPDDVQQNVLVPRAYDVLLYEFSVGGDPDEYVYWHSSQATSRGLNLANYRSAIVDDALDSARAQADPSLRDAKYITFAQQWLSDAPAIALYQPNLHYVTTPGVQSVNKTPLNEALARYYNVRYWSVNQTTQNRTP